MGELADDLMEGRCCEWCGIYFEADHGYPVICRGCFAEATPEERNGVQRATINEL